MAVRLETHPEPSVRLDVHLQRPDLDRHTAIEFKYPFVSLLLMDPIPRPPTPEYLREATFRMLGMRCLRCGTVRPLEVAHIMDWPTCVAAASKQINGMEPPADWRMGVALQSFHNLGNVLPLCRNCHGLYDGRQHEDVTECEIRGYRDAAVREAGALARLIDFVGTELHGRPNRCTHMIDGRREHSHMVDLQACAWPLIWLAQGYRDGALAGDPHLVVPSAGAGHHHVHLDTTTIALCGSPLAECNRAGQIWSKS
ncbi:MAG: HNH endonuclease [Sporichthyaceae bacterium]